MRSKRYSRGWVDLFLVRFDSLLKFSRVLGTFEGYFKTTQNLPIIMVVCSLNSFCLILKFVIIDEFCPLSHVKKSPILIFWRASSFSTLRRPQPNYAWIINWLFFLQDLKRRLWHFNFQIDRFSSFQTVCSSARDLNSTQIQPTNAASPFLRFLSRFRWEIQKNLWSWKKRAKLELLKDFTMIIRWLLKIFSKKRPIWIFLTDSKVKTPSKG